MTSSRGIRTDPDAVSRARRHLRLTGNEHDAVIRTTLERRVEPTAEGYRWPDWMRAALVWCEPTGGG